MSHDDPHAFVPYAVRCSALPMGGRGFLDPAYVHYIVYVVEVINLVGGHCN